ncbi:MAG: hypothetical protein WD876_03135 [Candidatus Pacearchaeota archaeon]
MVNQGDVDLRAEDWRKDLVGFALQSFTLLEDLTLKGTSAWINHFYQESATELAGSGTRTPRGLGRGSELPTARVSWTLVTKRIEKYGLKDYILYEDAISDNVDVVGRTLLRLARGVVKSIEDEVFDVVTEDQSASTILTTTTTSIGGDQWDTAPTSGVYAQRPEADVLDAMRQIAANNYSEIYTGGGALWLSPKDYMSILVVSYGNGSKAPKIGERILADGRMEQMYCGLSVRISNSVVADYAVVLVKKRCATWTELESLKVRVEDHSPKDFEISAWAFGVSAITDPKAICLIIDTVA